MRHSKAQIRQFDSTHRLYRPSLYMRKAVNPQTFFHKAWRKLAIDAVHNAPSLEWGSPAKSTPLTEFQRVVAYAHAHSQPLG